MTRLDEAASNFIEVRRRLVLPVRSTPEVRAELQQATEAWLRHLAQTKLPPQGFALIAVGGLGRGELCAGSDLDLLLLHATSVDPREADTYAERLWYPIWDVGLKLDHSTRNLAQARSLAGGDFKVLLGLLDARTLWGDAQLLEQLRGSVLADWRSQAKQRLPQLRANVLERRSRAGDLAHLLEPDLKESYGGLREFSIVRAVAASWLTDQPRGELLAAHAQLLAVRDALHRITARSSDRLAMSEQAEVARLQGYTNDDHLLRAVSTNARKIANASDELWHRVERELQPKRVLRLGRPRIERVALAQGVVSQAGEVALAESANPATDPGLALRAAAAAAQNGLWLSRGVLERIMREGQPLSAPWPTEARASLVSLLGAGPAAVPVFEVLDSVGYLERTLPHWAGIRSLPQRNALHIYTVDRHSVETAVNASKLARDVSRPDLLLIGALFHDIGKGEPDHCARGAEKMREIAPALGFGPADAHVLGLLVRHHLLLAEAATSRDLDDPQTIEQVALAVETQENLELLHALTLADSAAASPNVLTAWKRSLIADLVARVGARLAGQQVEATPSLRERTQLLAAEALPSVEVVREGERVVIKVQAADRLGLLAAAAGVLAANRLEVEAAMLDTVDGVALQEWSVHPAFGEPPAEAQLRDELERALSDPSALASKLLALQPVRRARGFTPAAPRVEFVRGASLSASVLRVRAHDEPALLYRVANALAEVGCSVNAARAATLGSEVVDVLYLQGSDGKPLDSMAEAAVLEKVAAALL